uniref:Uncharacterized protein n=1 Tax=Arundo donax TaxID=35708 RepID=A0A0A9H3D5_ARUDO
MSFCSFVNVMGVMYL